MDNEVEIAWWRLDGDIYIMGEIARKRLPLFIVEEHDTVEHLTNHTRNYNRFPPRPYL